MKGHVKLSPELYLVAQCCQWNFPGAGRGAITPRGRVDWARFLRLARFHRVQGLVWNALNGSGCGPPDEIAETLARDAAVIAAANLQAAAECKRLLASFDDAKLRILFLKGLALGTIAYGTASIKAAIDIDILVQPKELDASADLLRKLGYTLVAPAQCGREALRGWHRVRKESSWNRAASSTSVDLHTRLTDNPRLLDGVDVNSAFQTVDVGNDIVLPTLARDELFAYLAVHGASSAWFRIKWISDFAALVSGLGRVEIVHLYRKSKDLGAGRAAGQALLLSHSLFRSLDQLTGLREDLRRDAAIQRLHAAALQQLDGRPDPVEPTLTPLGTLRIHWTQLLLQRGARFKWAELARQVRVMFP